MTITREDLRFTCGSEKCAAWLYQPAEGPTGRDGGGVPLIVMAHGLSGTRRDRLGPFAERFAEAGAAALVFDHRGFGDSGGEPDLFEPARQLEDWRAAIAFAHSLPGVDGERIATFGSSMGGGNALAAAAADGRIAAAISQVPFLDLVLQSHRSSPRVSARIMRAAALGRHLPVLGEPHEAAPLNAPGAAEGWRHVVASGEDSRWRDRVARPAAAIAAARRAPLGELRTYAGVDHFDVYDGPEHEALVSDQLDFLGRHLL